MMHCSLIPLEMYAGQKGAGQTGPQGPGGDSGEFIENN